MSKVRLKSKREIDLMRDSCRLAAEILKRSGELVRPGITTDEINTFVHEFTLKNGAIPSPLNYHGYPKSVCTSVNDCVTHGIPGPYVLKDGDIINIDVTCQLSGYHGDCSATYEVGTVSSTAKELVQVAKESLDVGIEACAAPKARLSDIGSCVEDLADEHGFSVVRDYCGHGIGRQFHEDLLVLHYRQNRPGIFLEEGMVFTIEPMINEGTWKVKLLNDGWTVLTRDGKLSA
ncbi:MAG TPA: type I methionyl aminopeptidase, partial [Fibrobacteraceae bacterium]|nr:type I methionyl aminopeptidase [Fibrobacteraceae bacterium]